MREDEQGGTGTDSTTPLVGYLVLLPEGTDPADVFTADGAQPVMHPVGYATAPPPPPPPPPVGDASIRVDSARRVAEVDGRAVPCTPDTRSHRETQLPQLDAVLYFWGVSDTVQRLWRRVHVDLLRYAGCMCCTSC